MQAADLVLEDRTVPSLRNLARQYGIIHSKLRKEQLIAAIRAAEAAPPDFDPVVMVCDTETTGLPERSGAGWNTYHPYQNHSAYDSSRIVQWSWSLVADDGTCVVSRDFIIRPEGFDIPAESVAFHNITTERAYLEGVPFDQAAATFAADVERSAMFVGHNVLFDVNVIKSELHRRGKTDALKALNECGYCCTMANSRGMFRADNRPMSLRDLFTAVTGAPPDEARLHNSSYDVELTVACYMAMVRRGGVAPV